MGWTMDTPCRSCVCVLCWCLSRPSWSPQHPLTKAPSCHDVSWLGTAAAAAFRCTPHAARARQPERQGGKPHNYSVAVDPQPHHPPPAPLLSVGRLLSGTASASACARVSVQALKYPHHTPFHPSPPSGPPCSGKLQHSLLRMRNCCARALSDSQGYPPLHRTAQRSTAQYRDVRMGSARRWTAAEKPARHRLRTRTSTEPQTQLNPPRYLRRHRSQSHSPTSRRPGTRRQLLMVTQESLRP